MRGDGSSNEERLRTGRRYRTDRTEGISDGVFAVSLTLLILDVRPPEGGVSQLVHGLVLIAPRLGTFALSSFGHSPRTNSFASLPPRAPPSTTAPLGPTATTTVAGPPSSGCCLSSSWT